MPDRPHRLYDLLPSGLRRKGRLLWTPDTGEAQRVLAFNTHLQADVFRRNGREEHRDLGSGMVTNVGAAAMANDWLWPGLAALGGLATLSTQNFHGTGIGTTTAAYTDLQLQTNSVPTVTTYQTGVQSTVTSIGSANAWIYKTVATINYTSTLAITEWGLFSAATVSAGTGSPFTAGTATTGTVTGTPLTASTTTARGHTQMIAKNSTATSYGLITSNTTSVFTVPAWYTQGGTATVAANPANADVFTIQPVMWDHKIFSAINVNNLDSVQFTYSLTVQAQG